MMVGDGPQPVAADDASLIHRTQAGDAEAFGVLYERYRLKVVGITRRYTKGDMTLAEDLAQDTWAKVFRAIKHGQYGERGIFYRFLARAATRLCLDYIKRDSTNLEHPQGLGQRGDPLTVLAEYRGHVQDDEALESVLTEERETIARRLIEALPDKEAAAVVLASAGATMDETARALTTTRSAVKARLWRARAIAELLILTDARFDAIRPEGMTIRRASQDALPLAYRTAREAAADA